VIAICSKNIISNYEIDHVIRKEKNILKQFVIMLIICSTYYIEKDIPSDHKCLFGFISACVCCLVAMYLNMLEEKKHENK